MLMKDPTVLQEWLTHARSIKAVEMEAPGIYKAARSRYGDKPVLAIRGISDVVGSSRDPRWTEYACLTAASFARALLGTGPIEPRSKEQAVANTAHASSLKAPALSLDEFGVHQIAHDYPIAFVGATLTNDELGPLHLKELAVTVRALWDIPLCMTGDVHPVVVPRKGRVLDLLPEVGSRHSVALDLAIVPGQRSGFRVTLFSRKALNADLDTHGFDVHPYGV